MDIGGDEAVRLGNQGTHLDLVATAHHRRGGLADVLTEQDGYGLRDRLYLDGGVVRDLILLRVYAAL